MMLLPLHSAGSSCCTRKNGARTFTAKRLSKSSILASSMLAALEMPALATRMSSRSPTIARTRFARMCGPAAGLADFGDDGVGLLLAVAVVDQHLRAGLCQHQGAGAADAARGAGDQGGFAREIAHDPTGSVDSKTAGAAASNSDTKSGT